MAGDISETTGRAFYSGSYKDIANICRAIVVDASLVALLTQEQINIYQEMVDREIDAQLENLYETPLKPFNKKMPDGVTRSIFPGDIARLAKYWTAGLVLQSEFQKSGTDAEEASVKYVEDSKKMLYNIMRFNHRLGGQEYKSQLRTMLPNFQPSLPPEAQF